MGALKVHVEIPNLLSGELKIDKFAVLMGLPMSGKTTTLRLIFDVLYASQEGVVPLEATAIADGFLDSRGEMRVVVEHEGIKAEIVCSKQEEEKASCVLNDGKIPYNAVFFPAEMEYILKYNYAPVYYESYNRFYTLINELRAGREKKGYGIRIPAKFFERELLIEHFQLYEKVNGKTIRLELSSSTSVKLSFLISVVKNGLLDDPQTTLLLLDDPQTNMHPEYELKLAYLLGLLAKKGYKVLLTTHDMDFLSMLSCIYGVPKALGLDERFDITPSLYLVRNGTIEEYDIRSSAIPTYTNTLVDLIFKYCE